MDILYDGIFGDISLTFSGNSIEIDTYESKEEEYKNKIRARLKSIDGDYDEASMYNIIKTIGSNILKTELVIRDTVFNMLTYDNLVDPKNLKVIVYRDSSRIYIGISVKGISDTEVNSSLEITVIRDENGSEIWQSIKKN